ncbi:MAG: hypothetical protein HND47_14175 [Chloroflexi bacterium]|nr:hypothetical protein [Chloroflexota bacterium]
MDDPTRGRCGKTTVNGLSSTVCFAGVAARASCRVDRDSESLRGRMSESERQVEGLFESLLAEGFG